MILALVALRIQVTTALLHYSTGAVALAEVQDAISNLQVGLRSFDFEVQSQVVLEVEREVRGTYDDLWENAGEYGTPTFERFEEFSHLLDKILEGSKLKNN